MSNQPPDSPKPPNEQNPHGELRSPLRPVHPDADKTPQPVAQTPQPPPQPTAPTPKAPRDPQGAIEELRHKMEMVARQYASGEINRAQFNAIYGRYNEQRVIIERLVERNPENTTWQQVATQGHTSFLLSHFEARALYYITYRLDMATPLMMGGSQQPDIEKHIEPVLRALQQSTNRPKAGLARKALESGRWLVLAVGKYAVTMVLFMLEPSKTQLQRVRDLHMDFERANHHALDRRTNSLHRMVFPQRALVE